MTLNQQDIPPRGAKHVVTLQKNVIIVTRPLPAR